MLKEVKRWYAINFDLRTADLKVYYSKTNPKQAYKEIAKYMAEHGFTHRQWSGYISGGTMTKAELIDFAVDMHKTFPWLISCEGSMDATVITSIFDIKQMILDSMEDEKEDIEIEHDTWQ